MTSPYSGEPFERIEEYKAVLVDIAETSARRQNANAVYITLNTILLTGLGAFLVTSGFSSWWSLGVVVALAITSVPINLTWRTGLIHYRRGLTNRYRYLVTIEDEFRARRGAARGGESIGLQHFVLQAQQERGGPYSPYLSPSMGYLEARLATFFLLLYPFVAVLTGILIYLVSSQLVGPPCFKASGC
jgi:hypothetical protein